MKASKKSASISEVKITEPSGTIPDQKKRPNQFIEEDDDDDYDLPLEDDLAMDELDLDEDDY